MAETRIRPNVAPVETRYDAFDATSRSVATERPSPSAKTIPVRRRSLIVGRSSLVVSSDTNGSRRPSFENAYDSRRVTGGVAGGGNAGGAGCVTGPSARLS